MLVINYIYSVVGVRYFSLISTAAVSLFQLYMVFWIYIFNKVGDKLHSCLSTFVVWNLSDKAFPILTKLLLIKLFVSLYLCRQMTMNLIFCKYFINTWSPSTHPWFLFYSFYFHVFLIFVCTTSAPLLQLCHYHFGIYSLRSRCELS